MDRKAIVAVTLASILLLASLYYQSVYAPKPRPATPAARAALTPAPPDAIPGSTATPESSPSPAAPVTDLESPKVPETRETLSSPLAEYVFTSTGAGIAETTLLKHIAEHGDHVKINADGPLPIGALTRQPGQSEAGDSFELRRAASGREITFLGKSADGVELSKKFTLPPDDAKAEEYVVHLEISETNHGAAPVARPARFVYLGTATPIHTRDLPRYMAFDWFRQGSAKEIDVGWFAAGKIPLLGIQTKAAQPEYRTATDNVRWAAVKNQYFTTIATLPEATGTTVWARREALPTNPNHFRVEGALGLPAVNLAAGETRLQKVDLYIGPKEYHRLDKLGADQDEVLHYGIFAIVSKFLLNSMNWLHSIFANFGGYATAIIVLTLCIKSVLWPLQNKATQSMKRMQAVQPKLNDLKEKYKDDPTRLNQEMMKLYKEYGINPVGGCLPMFIQIPIFFGFYSMLGTAIELRNSHFFWVTDLSQPDTVFHVAGLPINILPLFMAGTMFWQMAITPKSGDPAQQRIMMFMPLIFIAFSYNFAAALALYWSVQNIFSIVQLYLTRNRPAPALVKLTPPGGKRKR